MSEENMLEEDKMESREFVENVKTGDSALPNHICNINEASPNMEFKRLMKKVKKLEIMNFVIIGLLGIILIFSLISQLKSSTDSVTSASSGKELPKVISKTVVNKIINDIEEYYNNNDTKKLYNVLGDYAKTYITQEDFDKSMGQVNILGKMLKASYTHYTFLQNKDGADWFELNYVAKYEKGDGTARVQIKVNGDEWEVVGFKFNVDQFNNETN